MEVDPIGTQGGAVRFSAAEHAHKIAFEQRAAQLEGQDVAVNVVRQTATTNATFSPALYAQAAQYQLYTQSGTLAAMLNQQGLAAQPEAPAEKHPNEVKAVDSLQGATIDTHA